MNSKTKQEPRVIAMYLPQYHPITENDGWWGKGFTEWTNVRKAEPSFPGHYQPHVPGRLDYYDLRDSAARLEQAKLAAQYGIHGFCYYHYWFNGRRLLETPFNEVLKSGEPGFPFCLCWANENWTRRWDGADQEVLMAQHYSDEDSLDFINDLIPAFRDERYIRVNGKPLLLVYRTGLLPEPNRITEIWREAMIKANIGELYLVRVENHMHGPEPRPQDEGFDAAMEFAPYWGSIGAPLNNLVEAGGPDFPVAEDMSIYDYDVCMRNMLAKPAPDYKMFRGVFPGWDNTARRKTGSTLFLNSSPEKYAYWLSLNLRHTVENFAGDERLVFINAWNEWGEGCHLEPDVRHGLAYLDATRLALRQVNEYCRLLGGEVGQELFDFDGWYDDLRAIYGNYSETTDTDPERRLLAFRNLLRPVGAFRDSAAVVNLQIKLKDEMIAALQESLSWKLTAPIRKLLDRFK